jgi:hypothetical protein
MQKGRLRRRIVLTILALALVNPLTLIFVWDWCTFNLGTLQPGRIYRSGQMTAPALNRTIHDHRIKTVLNLRGVNEGQAWYVAERQATTSTGATQVDVSLATDMWLTRTQLRTLIEVLDTCDYPLLIHCEWGAERTGLISAFAELLRPGATLADARAQFSLRYLFYTDRQNQVLAQHIDEYESWLRAKGLAHSPQRFRRWAVEGYVPKTPNRGEWRFDPYPPITITRPEPSAAVLPNLEKKRR